MSLRSPLARVRHLGSAKDGTHHWWMQRLTSVALVPLVIWFVAGVVSLAGADHAAVVDWLQSPFNAVMMLLFTVISFHHIDAGLQIVIEDYVHQPASKLTLLLLVKGTCLVLGLVAVLSTLKIFLS